MQRSTCSGLLLFRSIYNICQPAIVFSTYTLLASASCCELSSHGHYFGAGIIYHELAQLLRINVRYYHILQKQRVEFVVSAPISAKFQYRLSNFSVARCVRSTTIVTVFSVNFLFICLTLNCGVQIRTNVAGLDSVDSSTILCNQLFTRLRRIFG